jgi:hypothetical protein
VAYAKDTSVSVEKTEGEIKGLLRRYSATAMAVFENAEHAVIAFEMRGRRITMKLPLPDRKSKEFTQTPTGKWARSEADAYKAWEQACRSKWRALFLCIKAKLESVESGIETFEEAFLAHVQMPDGHTIGEHVKPGIARAYETGTMQPLLPGATK